jgi:HK97 family phage prohead protease
VTVPDPTTFETRTVAASFEMRDDSTTGAPILEGYAATFDQPYNVGPFWEQIDKRAFDRTLGMSPDVRLLIDHEGQPLARTKSGTLTLSTDDHGLRARAVLDPSDPDVQRLLPKMRRGDLDEMSFAFAVVGTEGDAWDYGSQRTLRTLRELTLQGMDVSVVTYPANPNTAVSVRSQDLRAAQCVFVEKMAREMRAGNSLSDELLRQLQQVLTQLTAGNAVAEIPLAEAEPPAEAEAEAQAEADKVDEVESELVGARSLDTARRMLAALDIERRAA